MMHGRFLLGSTTKSFGARHIKSVFSVNNCCGARIIAASIYPKNNSRFSTATATTRRTVVYSDSDLEAMNLEQWGEIFSQETTNIASMDTKEITYNDSAQSLRNLLKSRILLHTDIKNRPERFFLAHRILAKHAHKLGPGFWIRFTVNANLAAGTVMALGTEKQVKELDSWQNEGLLACFSLTEKFAGVNSGLLVHTTADWDAQKGEFVLNSPNEGAKKNWISQGLVADRTVVVADLLIDGKSYGPHAFMMNLRNNSNVPSKEGEATGAGAAVDGIVLGDMGRKTVGNDLDNAWIGFNQVRLPKEALLNKYADISSAGEGGRDKYVQHIQGMPVFHMIGQRLFTGRVAVAQAALTFTQSLYAQTKEYTDKKDIWSPFGNSPLSEIPQLKHLYKEYNSEMGRISVFVDRCEKALCVHLKADSLPPLKLIEAIAAAKVMAVDRSIHYAYSLKNEVGSYALMAGTGFEQIDFLSCCKFAEGDSRILMQKMARDRMKLYRKERGAYKDAEKEGHASLLSSSSSSAAARLTEQVACATLYEALSDAQQKQGMSPQQAWDEHYHLVYGLARAVMDRIVTEFE